MTADQTREPQEEGADEDGMPYQAEVFFDEFPDIDPEELARFVNETDPDEEDVCAVEQIRSEQGEEVRLCSYLATLGDFHMAIMIHDAPSPAVEFLEVGVASDELKDRIDVHKFFVLLTNVGGEQYAPIENVLFLYKVGIGLCRQGGFAMGHPYAGLYFDGDFLDKTLELPAKASGDESMTIWKTIREVHEPVQMLTCYKAFLSPDGNRVLCTRGFSQCGFPDLMYEFAEGEDHHEITELFTNAFHYMMENGPVIQAGHTMGYDENVAFRFDEVPDDFAFPFPTFQILRVTKESG